MSSHSIGAQLRGDEPVHGRGDHSVAHRSQWRLTNETRNSRPLYERILIVTLHPSPSGRPWRFEETDGDERINDEGKRTIERVPDNEDTLTALTLGDRDTLTSLARETTTLDDLSDLRFEWLGRLVYAEATLENWYEANKTKSDATIQFGDGASLTWLFRNGATLPRPAAAAAAQAPPPYQFAPYQPPLQGPFHVGPPPPPQGHFVFPPPPQGYVVGPQGRLVRVAPPPPQGHLAFPPPPQGVFAPIPPTQALIQQFQQQQLQRQHLQQHQAALPPYVPYEQQMAEREAKAKAERDAKQQALAALAAQERAMHYPYAIEVVSQHPTSEEISALVELSYRSSAQQVVSGGARGLVTLWSRKANTQFVETASSRDHTHRIRTLARLENGGFISGSNSYADETDARIEDAANDTVRLWEPPGAAPATAATTTSAAAAAPILRSHLLAIRKEDHYALCALSNGMIVTCGTKTGSRVWAPPDASFATHLMFEETYAERRSKAYVELSDGMLFCGTERGALIYSVASDGRLRALKSHGDRGGIDAVAKCLDGKLVCSGMHVSGSLAVWTKPTPLGRSTKIDETIVSTPIKEIVVLPNGTIVSSSANGLLRVWQAPNKRGETVMIARHEFATPAMPHIVALQDNTIAMGLGTTLYVLRIRKQEAVAAASAASAAATTTSSSSTFTGAALEPAPCTRCASSTTQECSCCARPYCSTRCQSADAHQ